MKTKTFDCVEMKRRGGRAVYEAVKGMTVEQELDYWRTRTEELRNKVRRKPKTRRTA
jgi:hypothetical protein